MCVYMQFIYLPNYPVSFCGSATFRNEKTPFSLQVSLPPNLKNTHTRKGLNTLPLPKDSLQVFCFTTRQRSTIKEILDF